MSTAATPLDQVQTGFGGSLNSIIGLGTSFLDSKSRKDAAKQAAKVAAAEAAKAQAQARIAEAQARAAGAATSPAPPGFLAGIDPKLLLGGAALLVVAILAKK